MRTCSRTALAVGVLACWLTLGGCADVTIADSDDVAEGGSDGEAAGQDEGGGQDAAPECLTDFDCVGRVKGTTPCRLPACNAGVCGLKDKPAGTLCQNPGDVLSECQTSSCDADGQCALTSRPDGDACGIGACGQKCAAGQCVVASAADYDDQNPCTKDYCDQGKAVVHEPLTDLTIACDDGDPCSEETTCVQGACAGKPKDCGDGVPCTVDTCDTAAGCQHTADDKACDDGNPCTTDGCDANDGCKAKGFAAGSACDDGNACTDKDACDANGGCVGTSTCSCKADTDCKAENLCLGAMVCTAGKCVTKPENAVKCDGAGATACASSQCQPSTGKCVPTALADGLACDDGDACTTESACLGGICAGSKPPACDDGNPCTDDSCDAKKGCGNVPTTKACDDDNSCTDKDACANGACKGVAKQCDDGIACTFDACDKASGKCSNEPQTTGCDDKNPCTKDSCVAGKGCSNTADDGAACDDGDECTVDACKGGKCTGSNTCPCKVETAATDCNDNNPCTVDSCDLAAKKCKNDVAAADGKACDPADKCQQPGSGTCGGGVCKPGTKPIDCSSKNGPCATGTCASATGACGAVPKADGLPCDADGSSCTSNDACKGGVCAAGVALNCNDNNPCTADSCDKTKGCTQVPMTDAKPCDDGDACTSGDVCNGALCYPGKVMMCNDNSPCTSDYCKGGKCIFEPIYNCCTKVHFGQKFDGKILLDWEVASSDTAVTWRIRTNSKLSFSPEGALHYGSEGYDGFVTKDAGGNPVKNEGTIWAPWKGDVPGKSLTLRFRLYWDVEAGDAFDQFEVVTEGGGSVWKLPKVQLQPNQWHLVTVQIPNVATMGRVGFRFDSVDGAANENFKGIFVDDMTIEGPCE